MSGAIVSTVVIAHHGRRLLSASKPWRRDGLSNVHASSLKNRAPESGGLRILIADDNRDALATLTILLEEAGHEVRGVGRSADVLGVEREFKPHVVVLDLRMPHISGYDLARWLRSHYGERSPLLIALSGEYTRPSDRALSHVAGFHHYLTKPYTIEQLLSLIDRPVSFA